MPAAARHTISATTASAVSTGLSRRALGAGAGDGRGAEPPIGDGGLWATGAAVPIFGAGGAIGAALAVCAVTVLGPAGGNVGSLIVGAAVGFGGKLMRTVSFFGCTLPVSFFGGTAPAGTLGI